MLPPFPSFRFPFKTFIILFIFFSYKTSISPCSFSYSFCSLLLFFLRFQCFLFFLLFLLFSTFFYMYISFFIFAYTVHFSLIYFVFLFMSCYLTPPLHTSLPLILVILFSFFLCSSFLSISIS